MSMRDKIAVLLQDSYENDQTFEDAADTLLAALPGMVPDLVWDEWDGGLTCAHTPWGKYILGQDFRLSMPGKGSSNRYETETLAKAVANAHNAAAVCKAMGIAP